MSFPPIFKGPLVGGWLFTKTFVKTQSRQTKQISDFFQAVSDHIWRLPSFGDRDIVVEKSPRNRKIRNWPTNICQMGHICWTKKTWKVLPSSSRMMFVPFIPLMPGNPQQKKHKGQALRWRCAVAEVVAEGGWVDGGGLGSCWLQLVAGYPLDIRPPKPLAWWSRQKHPMAWWQTKGRGSGMVEINLNGCYPQTEMTPKKKEGFCQLGFSKVQMECKWVKLWSGRLGSCEVANWWSYEVAFFGKLWSCAFFVWSFKMGKSWKGKSWCFTAYLENHHGTLTTNSCRPLQVLGLNYLLTFRRMNEFSPCKRDHV